MKFEKIINRLLTTTGIYLAPGSYKTMALDGEKFIFAQSNKMDSPVWVVLGRDYYYETTKDYPISKLADLKKALRYETSGSPYNGIRLHMIRRIDEVHQRVTSWTIREDVFSSMKRRPLFIFPESLLIGKAFSGKPITLSYADRELFVIESKVGLYSGFSSTLLPNAERFFHTVGCHYAGEELVTLSTSDALASAFAKGFRENWSSLLRTGFAGLDVGFLREYNWRRFALTALVSLGLYLGGSSAWLAYDNYRLAAKIESKGDSVDYALKMQSQLQSLDQRIETLRKPLSGNLAHWQIWRVVAEMLQQDATIRNLEFKGDEFFVRGVTNKTTALLAKISALPYVKEVGLAAPVTRENMGESFAIRFVLQPVEAMNGD